jgi:hypothetical protein
MITFPGWATGAATAIGALVTGLIIPIEKAAPIFERASGLIGILIRKAPPIRNSIVIPPFSLSKGAPEMALLDLLPPAVKTFITTPEASDDIKLAEALIQGDATSATAALKAVLQDAAVVEPFKSFLGAIASCEVFDSFIASKLIEEANALKAAL